MSTLEWWKWLHVTCAVLSISGFFLRGLWMLSGSAYFQYPLTKRLPHLVDSLLLISAIAMLVQWQLNPLQHDWLLAKIIALCLYIASGLLAFRFLNNKSHRFLAWLTALLLAAYIVNTAFTKNIWPF